MARSQGLCIADSLKLCLSYAERLRKGISADQFARLANVGGTVVNSNHPAFIYGHLALYGPRVAAELGAEAANIPESFEPVFSHTVTCVDDPDGTVYPSMDEVTSVFFEGYQKALAALETASDEQFAAANPTESMIPKFPTIGSMHAFYVGGHMMIHMGQLSAWRRMMGMEPA